ncbi:MAG: LCP family protein [Oscillospiraceae bacterium]|jgi:LCP family protein required for cell wall assembly|nr:LCP family protein [Oscillospiraceae bacterium]
MPRKIPKYKPIKRRKTRMTGQNRPMGFVSVLIILTFVVIGAVALYMTGIFDPVVLANPLVETPADQLNIPPMPTRQPEASLPQAAYTIASSAKVSGITAEQREQVKQDIINANLEVYSTITADWDIDQILEAMKDVPDFYVKDTSRIVIRASELNPNKNLPDTWTNILMLGTDDRDANKSDGRTDVMIIASLNSKTGEIKLSSLARDMFVNLPVGGAHRINEAHAYGGPNLAMKTVNELFDMNITKYVRVNLHGVVDIIDVFGGVDIELQPGEAEQINYNVAVSEDYEGFEKNPDRVPIPKDKVGLTRLDALQALGYARIRHIDSDFARTNRQRALLDKLLGMAFTDASPAKVLLLANVMVPYTATNLALSDIVRIGANMVMAGLSPMESLSVPIEGAFKYVQIEVPSDDETAAATASVLDVNLTRNRDAIHTFIYGEVIPR